MAKINVESFFISQLCTCKIFLRNIWKYVIFDSAFACSQYCFFYCWPEILHKTAFWKCQQLDATWYINYLSIKCQMKPVVLSDILLLLMSIAFIPQMEIFPTISSGFKCHLMTYLMWLKSNKVSSWQAPGSFHNSISSCQSNLDFIFDTSWSQNDMWQKCEGMGLKGFLL